MWQFNQTVWDGGVCCGTGVKQYGSGWALWQCNRVVREEPGSVAV